jgi:hypothetical protein
MGRKLEWELSGKSDVPQKMAQAKASMEGLEGAANAVSKKFREAFKDIALSFIAPAVLVNKAIGFLMDKIEEAKRKAQEARDFAKDEESKRYAPSGGREAVLQLMEQQKEEENRQKGQALAMQGYQHFLEKDPRGRAILEEYNKSDAAATNPLRGIAPAAVLAGMNEEVQKKIEAILAPDVSARTAAEDAKKSGDKAKDATAKATGPEVGSNVVGVGQSPQLEAMRQQTDLLASIDMTLRGIVNAGVHPSSANLTEKGQVGSQAPSGFLFGYTQILGSRISR